MALPIIVRQPRYTAVEIYNVAIFECIARSYGSVSITWRRWNSKLPVTASVSTIKSVNEVKGILRIKKSIGYYKGYYYCVIKNVAGTINSTYAYCNVTGTYVCLKMDCENGYDVVYCSLFYSNLSSNDHTTRTCHCTP